MARESSLAASHYRNLFLASYWEWRSFKAGRLPLVTLNLTPATYNRYMTQRYDFDQNIDVYRAQQTYSASGSVDIAQNFDLLGGTFYASTSLTYLRNMGGGSRSFNQFSAVPVRIGYRQNLIGYNELRWDRRIAPMKYEQARNQLVANMEEVSEEAVAKFFAVAIAQGNHALALRNLASADTMLVVAQRRQRIAAVTLADVLTLRLDSLNAENSLENARAELRKAMSALSEFLGMGEDAQFDVEIPGMPIPVEIDPFVAVAMAAENSPEVLNERKNLVQAQRDVAKARMETRFNASVNASVGFNQVDSRLSGAYSNLLRQDIVSVSVAIPLVDWGMGRGKRNMAASNLQVAQTSLEQQQTKVRQDVENTLADLQVRRLMIQSASQALDLAEMAFEAAQRRFLAGSSDLSALTLARQRQDEAARNRLQALQNYWESYYRLRRLTLYDFERHISLSLLLPEISERHK